MATVLISLLLVFFLFFSIGWFISFRIKVFSWLDFFWSSSFLIIIGALAIFSPYKQSSTEYILYSMYAVWSLRLSIHLFRRLKNSEEDKRYIKLIHRWKDKHALYFYLLFLSEGILALTLSLPLFLNLDQDFSFFQWAGLSLFAISLLGESLSDHQLKKFIKKHQGQGKVCNVGFWRYSRHPNYFFEVMIWFSYSLFVFNADYGYLGLIPFSIMFLLITQVTGIPPAEESSLKSKKEAYITYQKTTNKFFPWFPKAILIITLSLFMNGSHLMAETKVETNAQTLKIEKFFNDLRADNMDILDDFYHKDVLFIDPLGKHTGVQSVKSYYSNLYKNVESIRFDFSPPVSQGKNHVVFWKMILKAKSLNNGEAVVVDGNSLIKFDDNNLVTFHRDYFDMGEFIYEQVPLLGWIISKVKNRLKAH